MSDGLLLDTHIVLWLDSGNEHLRPSTRTLIDQCWRSGGIIYTSSITAWEIALLVDRGLVDLDVPVDAWVQRFLQRPGIEAIRLSHSAASRSYQLHHLEHRDPADRLLIATAIELACPLVTYDAYIASFGRKHGRQYRFAVSV
jgi:PIN domain nuclease of toxin-antitoxin system